MCLQRSVVITCLLRSRGLPAELVLGAQEYPPKAHAWTEVNGVVVNDHPAVRKKYRQLRRV
jgi:prolyl oligopeptidase